MADFISREAAIVEIKRFIGYLDEDMIERLRIAINRIPAADVRQVVRGKWYWNNYRYDWCCSNCSHSADHYIGNDDAYKEPSFKFCPHCGADMREPNLDATKGDSHD